MCPKSPNARESLPSLLRMQKAQVIMHKDLTTCFIIRVSCYTSVRVETRVHTAEVACTHLRLPTGECAVVV